MDAGGEGVGDEGGLNAAQRSLDGTIDLAQLDLPAHLRDLQRRLDEAKRAADATAQALLELTEKRGTKTGHSQRDQETATATYDKAPRINQGNRVEHDIDGLNRILRACPEFTGGENVAAPARDQKDVRNEIGLVKFPPTLLIAGAIQVAIDGCNIAVDSAYFGFLLRRSPDFLARLQSSHF